MSLLEITGLIIIPAIALLTAITIGIIQIRQNSQKTKYINKNEISTSNRTNNKPIAPIKIIEKVENNINDEKQIYRTDITPIDISSHLENLPPFQAETIKNTYKGVLVEWKLFLSTISIVSTNTVRINLINDDNKYPLVSSCISISDYPDIKIIKKGTPITIRGKIDHVNEMYIELLHATLSFHPTPREMKELNN